VGELFPPGSSPWGQAEAKAAAEEARRSAVARAAGLEAELKSARRERAALVAELAFARRSAAEGKTRADRQRADAERAAVAAADKAAAAAKRVADKADNIDKARLGEAQGQVEAEAAGRAVAEAVAAKAAARGDGLAVELAVERARVEAAEARAAVAEVELAAMRGGARALQTLRASGSGRRVLVGLARLEKTLSVTVPPETAADVDGWQWLGARLGALSTAAAGLLEVAAKASADGEAAGAQATAAAAAAEAAGEVAATAMAAAEAAHTALEARVAGVDDELAEVPPSTSPRLGAAGRRGADTRGACRQVSGRLAAAEAELVAAAAMPANEALEAARAEIGELERRSAAARPPPGWPLSRRAAAQAGGRGDVAGVRAGTGGRGTGRASRAARQPWTRRCWAGGPLLAAGSAARGCVPLLGHMPRGANPRLRAPPGWRAERGGSEGLAAAL
jgi:hypothetical protein